MAITTYGELQAAVARWMHRDGLAAVIPDFIALAHERAGRRLRVRQMEVDLAATAIADYAVAVPSGTVGVKLLQLDGAARPLDAATFQQVKALRKDSGDASAWAWQGDSFEFDGTGTVEGVLYTAIPTLSESSPSNWLLAASPSLYLFGALAEGFVYVRNEAEAALWDGRFKQALEEVEGADARERMGAGMRVRARR